MKVENSIRIEKDQVNGKEYVTDYVSYPYKDYLVIDKEKPNDFSDGGYQWIDNEFVLDVEKRKELMLQREETIKEKTILELIEWGVIQ